jgi:hypothetical protein
MRLLKMLVLVLALGAPLPAMAQDTGSGDVVIPVPPPRPAHLGGADLAATRGHDVGSAQAVVEHSRDRRFDEIGLIGHAEGD